MNHVFCSPEAWGTSQELKKARKKMHLTQETCAELLEHSLSFHHELLRLLSQCDEDSLKILTAAVTAIVNQKNKPSV